MVPLLLLVSGRTFGVSSSLRHTCAAVLPGKIDYFNYDWWKEGGWNLAYVFGILIGGIIAVTWLGNPNPIAISSNTVADLTALGITDFSGLAPAEIFSWSSLGSLSGLVVIILGGFFLGFGARYAGGCTSGHGITGLATFEWRSLVAVIGFFIGGFFVTYVIYPIIL
jgi:uncharacterized membrane protein YedE/YeeE